ncbi:hypothetical protein IGI04_007148 [Brassica rapa subsp. trilocularis]|uniref:Uncharacterized protein n=1 Tax=Brassica rapa subsp. trilocularis TaxID=1813537 RepID=A0ABQ7NJ05_BRACM|nr:hypothetical protein IGI04_007148 [Brassica rapa subsp. trilocularis]
MNNQFEALNAPKIDLPFFFFHSCDLNTTYLSLSLHNELKKLNILILKFSWFIESVRQTTYLGSRLAVDDLPFSRLAVDDLPGSRLVNAEKFDFPRRLTFQSRRLNFQSSEITDFKVNCKNNLCVDQTTYKVQTTSKKSRRLLRSPDEVQTDDFARRLLGSSDDFQTTLQEVQTTLQEVQTTFRKSRRLPDDFQMTSRRLTIRTLYNKKLPNEEKSDIRTYQNAQKNPDDFLEVQTTSWKSRRLPGSPDDFLEVQTTSWKSRRLPGSPDDFVRRLPDDFQTTSRRLTVWCFQVKEIRERLESFRMMNITFLLQPFERRRENV